MTSLDIKEHLMAECQTHLHKYKELNTHEVAMLHEFTHAYIEQVMELFNTDKSCSDKLLKLLTPI